MQQGDVDAAIATTAEAHTVTGRRPFADQVARRADTMHVKTVVTIERFIGIGAKQPRHIAVLATALLGAAEARAAAIRLVPFLVVASAVKKHADLQTHLATLGAQRLGG